MDAEDIQQVRSFNRLVTKRIGALEQSYLHRGRPLGEARLLFEVGLEGADVRALRGRLGLDSGYLSRLLRSLEGQGLVAVGRRGEDGRVRRVTLTAQGQGELAAYDALSDELAHSMLAPLDEGQRRRLTAAMAEVERLIRTTAVEVHLEPVDSPDARWCLDAYFRELHARFEGGFDPDKANPLRDADIMPPHGVFAVARLDGEAVGCGALKAAGPGLGEIKRMWTAPTARRLGIARRLLRALEAAARERGYAKVRLDSNRVLKEAHALYRKEGYVDVAPFNSDPYAHYWFEKHL